MSEHRYTASIVWRREGDFAGNAYSRGHVWRFDGGVEVPAAASPQIVPGSPTAAVDPEEAFVASLSACHMLWFLDMARREGLVVEAYEDAPDGVMERVGTGRRGITTVMLRPAIRFSGRQPDAALLDRLHRDAHERCNIANSVTSKIVIEPRAAPAAAA